MASLLHSSLLQGSTNIPSSDSKDDDMIALKCIDGTIHLPKVEAKKVLGKYFKSFDALSSSPSASIHIPIQVVLNAYSVYKDSNGMIRDSIQYVDKHIKLFEEGSYFSMDCTDPLIPFIPFNVGPTPWGATFESVNHCQNTSWNDVSCVLKCWMPLLPEIIKDQMGDYWDSVGIHVIYKEGYDSIHLNITQIMDIYSIIDPKFASNIIRRNSYLMLPLYLDVLFGHPSTIATICVKTLHNPFPFNRQASEQLLNDYDGPRIQIRFPTDENNRVIRELQLLERLASPLPIRIMPSEFNVRVPSQMIERGIYGYEFVLADISNRYTGWAVAAKVIKMHSLDVPSGQMILYCDQKMVDSIRVEIDDLRRTNWLWMPFVNPNITSDGDYALLLVPSEVTKIEWTSGVSKRVPLSVYNLIAPFP